ncbi:MAG: leucine-rich repeat domain-containing protein [Bacillales bacterium]|nr:leucine-rich repeat domain-containing protein [Bacillales bacterium]
MPSSCTSLGYEILSNTSWAKGKSSGTVFLNDILYRNYDINLLTYTLPSGTRGIADQAFANAKLLETIILPASLITLGYATFSECESLLSIQFGETNPFYTASAGSIYSKDFSKLFLVSPGYVGEYIVESSVKSIEQTAFYSCRKIVKVRLNDGLITIGVSAFRSCTNLAEINITKTVQHIDNLAFALDTSLLKIYIPINVVNMGGSVFYSWNGQQEISIEFARRPSSWSQYCFASSNARLRWNVRV